MFGRVSNTSLHLVPFRLKYFLVGGTFNDCDTVKLTKKWTNNILHRYYNCQMLIQDILFLHEQGPLFYGVIFWVSKYKVYSFQIQWKFSVFRHLIQSKWSKFKQTKTFQDSQIFDFALHPKLKTWTSRKIFVYFKFWKKLYLRCKNDKKFN